MIVSDCWMIADYLEMIGPLEIEDGGDSLRLPTSPELYAGSLFALPRNQFIGNKKTPEVVEEYLTPEETENSIIYLEGIWEQDIDNLELIGDEGGVFLEFTAREVNIVASPGITDVEIEVFILGDYVPVDFAGSDVEFDGDKAIVRVDQPLLYNVFKGDYGTYELELRVKKGFSFNAFTFG